MTRLVVLASVASMALFAGCTAPEPSSVSAISTTTTSVTAPPATSTTTSPSSLETDADVDQSSTTAASALTVATDVVYNQDTSRQTLDVHLPAGEGPFPVILAIHGGRWRLNSKDFYRLYAEHFPNQGVAFVPINYRFVPAATYPAQVADAFCALAWIHANADTYQFDRERVIVLGGSAGGNLAAMLGTVEDHEIYSGDCPHGVPDDSVAGAVIFYGIFDFTTIDDYPSGTLGAFQGYWGATYDELSPDELAEMSPMSWVDGTEPPFLVIHGTRDTTIPTLMSERFVAALDEAGVPAELLLVDSGHGFENYPLTFPEQIESLAAIDQFAEGLP